MFDPDNPEYLAEYLARAGSRYDMFKLFIGLRWTRPELNDAVAGVPKRATAIHEYTHYLQSITTVYGMHQMLILLEFLIEYLWEINRLPPEQRMNADRGNDTIRKILEKRQRIGEAQYFAKECISLQPDDGDIQPFALKIIKERIYNSIDVAVLCIFDADIDMWVPLSPATLRETMATMADFIYRGAGSEGILAHEELVLDNPQYFIILKYLVHKLPTVFDSRRIAYYLAELSLMTLAPTKEMKALLELLETLLEPNGKQIADENELFNQILELRPVKETYKRNLRSIEKVIVRLEKLLSDLPGAPDLKAIVRMVIGRLKAGVRFRDTQPTLLWQSSNRGWLESKATLFGSPVVRYSDGFTTMFGKQSKRDAELGAYLFGLLHFAQNFGEFREMTTCPFLKELPICGEDEKPLELCEERALEVDLDESGEGCLLANLKETFGLGYGDLGID